MQNWLQHLLVLLLVATCVAVVGRQLIGTFRFGKGSKLGSCCAKGCEPQAAKGNAGQQVVFIPSNSLRVRK